MVRSEKNERKDSITRSLNIIGDQWTCLVLMGAFQRCRRFKDWQEFLGISRSMLSKRLKWLESNDILRKKPIEVGGKRHVYELTRKGLDLYPCVLAAWGWERKWSGPGDNALIKEVHHTVCRNAAMPKFVCGYCKEPLALDEVRTEAVVDMQNDDLYDSPNGSLKAEDSSYRRWNSIKPKLRDQPGWEASYVALLADRWTFLIVSFSFECSRRFDDYCSELDIATNILSNRLSYLCSSQILNAIPYQTNPNRYDYILSERGRDLYPLFLMLHFWGDRWLSGPEGPPQELFHTLCGHRLQAQSVCGSCGGVLDYRDTEFR